MPRPTMPDLNEPSQNQPGTMSLSPCSSSCWFCLDPCQALPHLNVPHPALTNRAPRQASPHPTAHRVTTPRHVPGRTSPGLTRPYLSRPKSTPCHVLPHLTWPHRTWALHVPCLIGTNLTELSTTAPSLGMPGRNPCFHIRAATRERCSSPMDNPVSKRTMPRKSSGIRFVRLIFSSGFTSRILHRCLM